MSSIGVGLPFPTGAIWPEVMAKIYADLGDGWSAWVASDQSLTTDYFDIPMPDAVRDWVVELQLVLKNANDIGWYTRYRTVRAGVVAGNSTAVIGSYTGVIYTQASYSAVTVDGVPTLRCSLTGLQGPLTRKRVFYRWHEV